MTPSEEELKSLLIDLGTKLQKPPTSVKELLALLDMVDICLSRVEQSPSKAIQNVLSPTLKALVEDDLLRHADVDVKVSVASCISEITRITAPEVPYEDDKMTEVFQLIVASFESLADMSSQSYSKRTSILETVAKVRSSVVMLDLECDGLILEMFQHFIKTIRDYHPQNVFSCMESIMTRIIEESDEIPLDLLFCILDTVKKDKKEVTPRAQTLMKKLIETCADKLKPYIEIAMRTKGVSLADYDEVASLICNEASAEVVVQSEQTDASVVNVVHSSKPVISSAETVLTEEETQATAVNSTELPPGGCSELVTSNGNAAVEGDTLSGSSTLHDFKTSYPDMASEIVTSHPSASVSNPDGVGVETDTIASETIILNPENKDAELNAENIDEGDSTTEPKTEKIMNKRGRKAKAKKKVSEPVKQLEDMADSHKNCIKDISPSTKGSQNEASGHSSPKSSKEIYTEADEKLNGSPKSKVDNGPKAEEGIKKRVRGKGKATLQKLAAQAVSEDNNKEATTSQKPSLKAANDEEEMIETPKTGNKRKCTEPNSNESKNYGEELVGSKVKIWWPADKKFYKGVIDSFDSAKKKHKVLYADGEVENLHLKKQRWEVVDPDEDSDTQDEETHTETPATEKRHKAKEANEGTSKKRLGRPPSIKSNSASGKSKSLCKSGDDSKGAKDKTDNSNEEDKSKEETGKRLGRPKADVSKSTSRLAADEPSAIAAGKSKTNESKKLTEKYTTEDSKSGEKPKGCDSKTSIKGGSDSNSASNIEDDNNTIKQRDKDNKGKRNKSGNATPVIKSSGKSKIKEPSKSKAGPSVKEGTSEAVSDAKNDGISLKTAPKSSVEAPATEEVWGSDGEEAAEEQSKSPAKAAGSSKRKASHLETSETKSGAKAEAKGKKGRKS